MQIRSKFEVNSPQTEVEIDDKIDVENKLFCFECTTTDEVLQIVSSYEMKCSPEDPIPALILKENLDFFVPVWTKLVNLSLSQGSMGCLKSVILIPLIKDF